MPINPGFSPLRNEIGGLVFHISSLTGLGTTCLAYSYRYSVPDGTFSNNMLPELMTLYLKQPPSFAI